VLNRDAGPRGMRDLVGRPRPLPPAPDGSGPTSVYELVERLWVHAGSGWGPVLRYLALLVVPFVAVFACVGALVVYLVLHAASEDLLQLSLWAAALGASIVAGRRRPSGRD
jgi:hypothetical protein